jgi:metallophosphoesterase (TIGR00282 family)
MPDSLRILAVGDIFARPGRSIITGHLKEIREKHEVDLCIANAENAAGGYGLTPNIADSFLANGVDFITLGDHTWDRDEIEDYLNTSDRVLRPANYPKDAPGKGVLISESSDYGKIAIVNLLGRVFMKPCDSPFTAADAALREIGDSCRIIIVDMHAEATSEKRAMGAYLDGKVTAVFGTHTHIPTADEAVLKGGTGYITDIGMTGSHDSIIGLREKEILMNYRLQVKRQFKHATGDLRLGGALIEVDRSTGRCRGITRVEEKFSE